MIKASNISILTFFTLAAVPFNVTYAEEDGANNLFELEYDNSDFKLLSSRS